MCLLSDTCDFSIGQVVNEKAKELLSKEIPRRLTGKTYVTNVVQISAINKSFLLTNELSF
jgi:hypothetical protein